MKIKIQVEKGEDGFYVATVPSLPGCISQGKTIDEAKANIKEAIELHLKALLEDGVPIITPRRAKLKTISVSV
jgi:predicted RNase H-like HicB family nuclease